MPNGEIGEVINIEAKLEEAAVGVNKTREELDESIDMAEFLREAIDYIDKTCQIKKSA